MIVQVRAEPVQAPDQPVKYDVVSGAAVKVSIVPPGKAPEQVPVEHWMPTGILVTTPPPAPPMVSATLTLGFVLKLAPTDLSASIVSVQVCAVPVQAPSQPTKVVVEFCLTLNVTLCPLLNALVQVLPQSIPAGCETIELPEESPFSCTVRDETGVASVD